MCNVERVFDTIKYKVRGRSLSEIYPAQIVQNWSLESIRSHYCIKCGQYMRDEEMYPPGALTPRAMCSSCYDKWKWFVKATGSCIICGGSLEGWRLNNFYSNPKEVSNRIHDGQCKEYFSLLSVKALGHSTGLREDSFGHAPQYQIPQAIQSGQTYLSQEDKINAMYEDIQRFRQELLNEAEIVSGRLEAVGNPMLAAGKRPLIPSRTETYKDKPIRKLKKIFKRKW